MLFFERLVFLERFYAGAVELGRLDKHDDNGFLRKRGSGHLHRKRGIVCSRIRLERGGFLECL